MLEPRDRVVDFGLALDVRGYVNPGARLQAFGVGGLALGVLGGSEHDPDEALATEECPSDSMFFADVSGGVGLELTDEGRIKKSKRADPKTAHEDLVANADEPCRVLRFANRVPLLYQQSACAVTKGVIQTNWRGYGITQPRGALPIAPMAILVHIASVWVPFTSESKEAVAAYDEIHKEIRLALQEVGRRLGAHVRKQKRIDCYAPNDIEDWLVEECQLSNQAECSEAISQLFQLGREQRDVFILVIAMGYSYEEAAQICNCSIGTIKSRISRARANLAFIRERAEDAETSDTAITPAPHSIQDLCGYAEQLLHSAA